MIKKHETSNLVRTADSAEILEVFESTVDYVNRFRKLWSALNEFDLTRGEEDDLLDLIDDTIFAEPVLSLQRYSLCACSTINVINKYLQETMTLMELLLDNLKLLSSSGCAPTSRELPVLQQQVYDVTAGLSYFVFYEFGVCDLLTQESTGNCPVDEVFYSYLQKTGIPQDDFVIAYCVLTKSFKMRLEVFEEYPKKEEAFEAVMGPYYVGVDSRRLTVELVDKVIAGEITPEELCSLTNSEEG